MSFVVLYSVSSTGADDGHRFAAFSIVRSGGMTNCSRTDDQNRSSGDAGVGGRSLGTAQALPGERKGAAPPIASRRAKSRRFIKPPRRFYARRYPGVRFSRVKRARSVRRQIRTAPYISALNAADAAAVPQ